MTRDTLARHLAAMPTHQLRTLLASANGRPLNATVSVVRAAIVRELSQR